MTKSQPLLEKLLLIKENPGYYNGLSPEEQAELFLFLLEPKKLFRKPKTIKGPKGDPGKDGKSPVKGVDFLSKEDSLAFLDKLGKQVETRLESLTDGKDAEITPDLIENIVKQVVSRITIPEFVPFDDSSLVESIENALLDHEELRDEVEKLKGVNQTIIGGGAQVNWVKKYVTDALSGISVTGVAESFETVSKNLSSYDYAINYSGSNISTIVYTKAGGTITKTLNYTGNEITSVVLSGDTPGGIDLTKTLTWAGGLITNAVYS